MMTPAKCPDFISHSIPLCPQWATAIHATSVTFVFFSTTPAGPALCADITYCTFICGRPPNAQNKGANGGQRVSFIFVDFPGQQARLRPTDCFSLSALIDLLSSLPDRPTNLPGPIMFPQRQRMRCPKSKRVESLS